MIVNVPVKANTRGISQLDNTLPPELGGRGGQRRANCWRLENSLCTQQDFALAPLVPQFWGEHSQYIGLFQRAQEMPS